MLSLFENRKLDVNAKELFESSLGLVEQVIAFICRRHRLYDARAEDFASYARLALIDSDYAILRKFEGRSSLGTYLTTVIHRLYLDYLNREHGKWRPSAKAKELGPTAVRLETLVSRDSRPVEEAVELLITNDEVPATRSELIELAACLPHHAPRRFEGEATLEHWAGNDSAEQLALDRERGEVSDRIASSLDDALRALTPDERLILKMRFRDGFTLAQIAEALHVKPRSLYSRSEKALKKMKRVLESRGVGRGEVASILGWKALMLKVNYDAN